MREHLHKNYPSNEEGKREFVDEVICPIVLNEQHFTDAVYVTNDRGEYIMLYRQSQKEPAYAIDVTADSIEALIRDFMKQFPRCVDREFWDAEYEKEFKEPYKEVK